MKVVRVIKWIAFVVFILAFALNLVANGFIMADVVCAAKATSSDAVFSWERLAPNEKDLSMSDVKTYLAESSYSFDNLRALLKPYAESAAAEEEPVVVTPVEPVAPEVPEVPETPDVPETPVIPDEPVESDGSWGTGSSGSMAYDAYDVKDHCNLVFGVMKYGSASCEFNWITEPAGLKNVSISISFFVALVALLLAFILHIISKRYKTVYGTILMILGFVFFFGLLIAGVFAGDYLIEKLSSFDTIDAALAQFCSVAVCGILGTLIGLPIYSCGVRQITCKRLRRRLRRKKQ